MTTNVETRLNEPAETNSVSGEIGACQFCEKPYERKRDGQRFCSTRCRVASWNAAHPRFDLGQLKFKEKDRKPTPDEIQAAGFRVRGRK